MSAEDPTGIVADAKMSRVQLVAVGLCILLNALDGFDILSVSFASPGIAKDWGINRAELGVVLSMELIGMCFGSVCLGNLCDRIGRRRGIFIGLSLMVLGMAAATLSWNIPSLSACRLLAGFGIGGMLAVINAAAAEHANARRRNLAVALMAGGYPCGAVVGGALVSHFLLDHGWRAVFGAGAIVTFLCIPLVWFGLPETVAWLARRRPANALSRINRTLARMGHPAVERLGPAAPVETASRAFAALFSPQLRLITVLLTLAYFAQIMTFYFLMKWLPKIVADMGFSPSAAGSVLVWANMGGVIGSVGLSLLTQRVAVRTLTMGAMLLGSLFLALFGRSGANLYELSLFSAVASVFTNAAVVGIYAIFAQSFPTSVRAGGTGFVIGLGRGGAALSPIVAGLLFSHGFALPIVAILMGSGSLIAVAAILMLSVRQRADGIDNDAIDLSLANEHGNTA